MANTIFENFVLENKFEDQYNSYLDLMQFCTVDNSLTEAPGMIKKIRVYSATNDKTEALAMGEGNTKTIEVSYNDTDYKVETLQNRFIYFDEEAMTDPLAIDKGLSHQAVDMFNTANAKAMAEFNKAEQSVTASKFNFDAFVDAVANIKDLGVSEANDIAQVGLFALVNKEDVAEIRKELKDLLSYVEAYARNGYIGTVAGVNIYTSAIATKGTIAVADKTAVTYFNKLGTEVEQERDVNIRQNTAYVRKYGIFALTDNNHICLIKKGA